jgi:mono/diheme cytochrome c family protein
MLNLYHSVIATLLFTLLLCAGSAHGEEGKIDFAREVQPIFAKKCYKCHGPGEAEGGLRLNSREATLAKLESDEFAVVPGKADSSAIVHRITSTDKDERMPPEGKPLTEKETAAIRKWIEQGAQWGTHWAFRKRVRPAEPKVNDGSWVLNPIDKFILARLEASGLKPAPAANKVALFRRAHYDLLGLPPTPEEIDAFIADKSDDAYEKVIDRLLKSPHYGEKWARYWLDLVRYAETNGYERDNPKDSVWRYRDYIITALNNDKPYDQFVIEQLAGDELEKPTAESITATGIYRLGLWDDEPVDRLQAYYDGLDDVIVTTSQAFLGLTVGCARCHDHKLDPIPQTDYYSMMAFFHNLKHGNTMRGVATDADKQRHAEQVKKHGERIKAVQEQVAIIEKRIFETFSNPEKEDAKDDVVRRRLLAQKRGKVLSKDELRQYVDLKDEEQRITRTQLPGLDKALAAQENGDKGPETFVLLRGSAHAKGDKVEPGFPAIISPGKAAVPETGRGGSSLRRMTLAKWITSPDNPMTARVMINRIWQHHFGRGIVRSASDFGYQGTPPTHPLLLDWLASEFIERGWSMKQMHKLIMMSATYRMSSQGNQAALDKDPTNDLIWRQDMRRLTAEEIRDSILAVGGTFNPKMFGPNIFPPLPKEILATASRPGAGWGKSSPEESARRSIYIRTKRSLRFAMLEAFDQPDTDTTCAARVVTTVPTQSLNMLNSQFMNEQADFLAKRIAEDRPEDVPAQVAQAIQLTTGRVPTEAEVKADLEFIEELKTEEKLSPQDALRNFCLLILNTNEFIYLD